MTIKELSDFEFREFTEKYPFSSIYQTCENGKIMQNEGYGVMYIGGIEHGEIVAASLILVKKIKNYNYAYAPRGFLIDYTNKQLLSDFTKELKKYLGKKAIVAVKLSPIIVRNMYNCNGQLVGTNPRFDEIFNNLKSLGYHHYGFNSFFEAMKPRFEAMVDISQNYQTLFKNIKREFKTKIRTAEERGIRIFRADQNEIGYIYDHVKNKYSKNIDFIENSYKYFNESSKIEYYYAKLDSEIYLKTMKAKYEEQDQYVAYLNSIVLENKSSSQKLISKKMDADNTLAVYKKQLIEATNIIKDYPTGLVLATIMVVKHRSEVTLYLDGYDKRYKYFNAKHLILWKVLEKYSSLGFKRFNLGGVTDIRIANEKYDGLNTFKTNFNASIFEYIGDLELVTNGPKYFMYRQSVNPEKKK